VDYAKRSSYCAANATFSQDWSFGALASKEVILSSVSYVPDVLLYGLEAGYAR